MPHSETQPMPCVCVCVCVSVCVRCTVVSDSWQPHGVQPSRLLCPWDSPGKNTGVGCHFLLQGIFSTQGSNLGLLHCRWILYHLSPWEAHAMLHVYSKPTKIDLRYLQLTFILLQLIFEQHVSELCGSTYSGFFPAENAAGLHSLSQVVEPKDVGNRGLEGYSQSFDWARGVVNTPNPTLFDMIFSLC